MFSISILSVCTKSIYNFALQVQVNEAEHEDASKLSRSESVYEMLFNSYFNIGGEL